MGGALVAPIGGRPTARALRKECTRASAEPAWSSGACRSTDVAFLRLGRCYVHPFAHRRAQANPTGARGFQNAPPALLSGWCFLAYESDESRRFEVFVQAFDPSSGSFLPSSQKVQIS